MLFFKVHFYFVLFEGGSGEGGLGGGGGGGKRISICSVKIKTSREKYDTVTV